MREIKEGTISGNLPSTGAASIGGAFAVHYPGYPSSTSRAIHTLKARSSKSDELELYFRPEDPYSHPVIGKLQPCNNFLLKISKRRVSIGEKAAESDNIIPERVSEDERRQSKSISVAAEDISQISEEKQVLCADIIAKVSEAYHFDGMVDYQHVLPVHADVARRKKRNWEDMEPQSENDSLKDMDQEDLMILVPPRFSIKDIPQKVVLKPPPMSSSKKKPEGVVQYHGEIEIEACLALDFYIENVPKKVDWEKNPPKDSELLERLTSICKLFDERPIWVKSSVAERLLDQGLECGDHMLKRLLVVVAYYFSNGPYLKFWIRKGYDPRKDPESRIYQRIDFRVPSPLRSNFEVNEATGLKHQWEEICSFRVFPCKSQISLQLFELSDDYIQKEIRKPPQQATCSCATGWFSSSMLERLRLCVAIRFLSVYPKTGAESLLKSVSQRFEKSRRAEIYAKDSKLEEKRQRVNGVEGTPQGNEEMIDKEDEGVNIDDEDEEDEIGGDNNEGFEPYEGFRLVGEDSNSPLQPCSSVGDKNNISRTYLQDLFGSFPSCGLQGAENSEEEYQIYEQSDDDDPDGNFSDDDCY